MESTTREIEELELAEGFQLIEYFKVDPRRFLHTLIAMVR